MKTMHPLFILLLVIITVGASVIVVIQYAIVPLSSEHSTLQDQYVKQTDELRIMTEQYKLAKVLVQNAQDRLDVKCLETYIGVAVTNLAPDTISEVAGAIIKYHREFGIPISLLVGMVRVESVFNPTAFSKANARGLMQVIFKYHEKRLAKFVKVEKELHNPDIGIHAGTLILTDYLNLEKGNLTKALFRYNGKNGKKNVYSSQVFASASIYSMFRAKYFFDNDTALNTVNLIEKEQAEVSIKTTITAGGQIK